MSLPFTIAGYLGSSILAVQLIPQIVKSYKSKSTQDLSYTMLFLNIIGLTLITSYNTSIKAYPNVGGAIFSVGVSISLMMMKMVFEREQQKIDTTGESYKIEEV